MYVSDQICGKPIFKGFKELFAEELQNYRSGYNFLPSLFRPSTHLALLLLFNVQRDTERAGSLFRSIFLWVYLIKASENRFVLSFGMFHADY